jgi:hypothetical protein
MRVGICLPYVLAALSAYSWPAQTAPFEDTVDPRPYIFVQQNNARPTQQVRLGYPLQVQLPGNPAVWHYQPKGSALVEQRGQAMVFSPGRIDDTQSIFVFDFVLADDAKPGDTGVITIISPNPPASLSNVVPGGVWQVRFEVIDDPK